MPRGRRSIAAVDAGARNPSAGYWHTMRESGFTGHHSGDPTGYCHDVRLYRSYRDPTESIVATQALQAKSPSPLMPRLIRWQRSVRAVPSIFWGDRCTGASVAVAVSRPICALETSFHNFDRFGVESSSRPGFPVNPAGLVSQSTSSFIVGLVSQPTPSFIVGLVSQSTSSFYRGPGFPVNPFFYRRPGFPVNPFFLSWAWFPSQPLLLS